MEFKQFKQHMQNIQDFLDESNKIQDHLQAICAESHVINTIGHKLFDKYVKLLSESVGDENEWIDYYIWECDMGTAKFKGSYREVHWKEGEKTIKVKMNSVEALWKVIKGHSK